MTLGRLKERRFTLRTRRSYRSETTSSIELTLITVRALSRKTLSMLRPWLKETQSTPQRKTSGRPRGTTSTASMLETSRIVKLSSYNSETTTPLGSHS